MLIIKNSQWFEPRTADIGIHHSANWATTTALKDELLHEQTNITQLSYTWIFIYTNILLYKQLVIVNMNEHKCSTWITFFP